MYVSMELGHKLPQSFEHREFELEKVGPRDPQYKTFWTNNVSLNTTKSSEYLLTSKEQLNTVTIIYGRTVVSSGRP